MIVVDLDGTLLNEYGKVSVDTKNYLTKLKNNGYIIVIATGRIYKSVMNATDGAEFANYLITDTGSCIYDTTSEISIFKNVINKETAKKIFEYYNDDFKYIFVCDKNAYYKYSDEIENSWITKTIKDKDYILNNCNEISHISIAMKNNDDVMKLYKKILIDIKEVDILIMQDSFSDRKWIEILPKNCSKYSAIKFLSDYLNIDNKDIIAFGDGLNDIEMLEKCGHGVALKNALPEVKKISNDVTLYDNKNNGVIKYLMEYLDVK